MIGDDVVLRGASLFAFVRTSNSFFFVCLFVCLLCWFSYRTTGPRSAAVGNGKLWRRVGRFQCVVFHLASFCYRFDLDFISLSLSLSLALSLSLSLSIFARLCVLCRIASSTTSLARRLCYDRAGVQPDATSNATSTNASSIATLTTVRMMRLLRAGRWLAKVSTTTTTTITFFTFLFLVNPLSMFVVTMLGWCRRSERRRHILALGKSIFQTTTKKKRTH